MPRPTRLPVALCALALTGGLVVADASAGAAPVARAAACAPELQPPSMKGGYIYQFVFKGVGCATGQRVALAFQACRVKHGVKGTCHTKVIGYSCHEKRQAGSANFIAIVACTNGHKKVNYTYLQNL
jgi:hypothetical protein